jgi:hypothetical protein
MRTSVVRSEQKQTLVARTFRLLGASKGAGKPLRYRAVRVPTDLPTEWNWGGDRREGRIRNLSAGGCFIIAEHELSVGDRVGVTLFVPDFLSVELDGLVVRSQRGEGFAVRFRRLRATEQLLLGRAIWRLSPRLDVRAKDWRLRAGRRAEGWL